MMYLKFVFISANVMRPHPAYLRIKIAINIFAINQTGRSTFSSLANFALSPIVCYSFANCVCSYNCLFNNVFQLIFILPHSTILLWGYFNTCALKPFDLWGCFEDCRSPRTFNNFIVRLFQGLRSYRKRSLLEVNEHFGNKRNAERAHKKVVKRWRGSA